MMFAGMRVLIVTENMSFKMGGESQLPFLHFQRMLKWGEDAYVVCHARCRDELTATLPPEHFARIHFVEDTAFQAWLWSASRILPPRVRDLIVATWIRASTGRRTRTLARDRLIPALDIQVVLQPAPISPKAPSHMYDVGVPVVIGPMCGGMDFPPGFKAMDSIGTRLAIRAGRAASFLAHLITPGKRRAAALLVAGECTRRALPAGCRGTVHQVVESGVDLDVWSRRSPRLRDPDAPTRFVYSGRFVDWKGVGYLMDAFASIANSISASLELIGGGELREQIEAQVRQHGLQDRVHFHGWLSHEQSREVLEACDVFVLPSLRECGGAVLLEAMALGMPCICTHWGGPGWYVDNTTGIRVKPDSPQSFVEGLAAAMKRLATDPALRETMAAAGPRRVRTSYFDYDSKTRRVLDILASVIRGGEPSGMTPAPDDDVPQATVLNT